MVTKSFLESELDKLSMRLTIRMGTIAALCVGALGRRVPRVSVQL
jgi:hypothetical protein